MPAFYSARDRSIVGAGVTGTVDADFDPEALTNGFPHLPVKRTGTLSLAVATGSPAVEVGVVAAMNHTVDAARPIVLTGDLSLSLTPDVWRRDGFSKSPFHILTSPQPVTGFTVTVTGNSVPVVIAELWAGECVQLENELFIQPDIDTAEPFPWESQMPPYDDGTEARRLAADTVVSDVGLAQIEGWYESTHRGTLPSLFIPDSYVNDAWLVRFKRKVTPVIIDAGDPSRSVHFVRFEFLECERTRW